MECVDIEIEALPAPSGSIDWIVDNGMEFTERGLDRLSSSPTGWSGAHQDGLKGVHEQARRPDQGLDPRKPSRSLFPPPSEDRSCEGALGQKCVRGNSWDEDRGQTPRLDNDDVLRSWSKPQIGDEVLNHLLSFTSGLALKGSQSDSFEHCGNVLELLGLSSESGGPAESRAGFDSVEEEESMVPTAEHPRDEVAALTACSPWEVADDTGEGPTDEAAREDVNEGGDGERDMDGDGAFDGMVGLRVLAQSSYDSSLGEQEVGAYFAVGAVGACYRNSEAAEVARMQRWSKTQVLVKARAAHMQAMVRID